LPESQQRKLIIQLASSAIIGSFLMLIIFIADSILLSLMSRKKNNLIQYNQVSNAINHKNKPYLNKKNFGNHLKEGSLVSVVEKRGGHHDNEKDYVLNSSGKNVIWIIGDSWGQGIHSNEQKNNTLEKILKGHFSKIRIFADGSWSPLLMNLAARHRSQLFNEQPNQVAVFLDQTDIGDDYCRYRPFVERDKSGRLLKVHHSKYSDDGHVKAWELNMVLGINKSGIGYTFKYLIFRIYQTLGLGIPGVTTCIEPDLLAWQKGEINTRNGTSLVDYENYFKQTVGELINELKLLNPEVKIILVTHDWAQHDLSSKNKDKFVKNISSITSTISKNIENVESIHISSKVYEKNKVEFSSIYQYPKDRFSHLTDSKILSSEIANKIKSFISKDNQ